MVLKKRKQSASRLADEIPIADYGADENITDNAKIQWVNQPWVRKLLRGAAMLSFVSLCFNTPKTFETVSGMRYLTLVVDGIVTLLFFAEMIAKMTTRGLIFVSIPLLPIDCMTTVYAIYFANQDFKTFSRVVKFAIEEESNGRRNQYLSFTHFQKAKLAILPCTCTVYCTTSCVHKSHSCVGIGGKYFRVLSISRTAPDSRNSRK